MKKNAQVQSSSHTEVKTQEEWDVLMQRSGLGVVDVYSNWCGPCKAILSLLRTIRNEQDDDFLFFALAESDCIDSLVNYRDKSEPTFLFYGDGQLVNVMRGCNGPMITKLISNLVKKERQIAEGIFERELFIDKAICKEAEAEEKQDIAREYYDIAEEELVSKKVTVAIIKADAVEAGFVEQIEEAIVYAGYEILQKVERLLTEEEVSEFYRQDEGGDNFEQFIEFMASGPCVALALSKAGEDQGEEIVAEFLKITGPGDVNTAKEEAPESLRAKFGTDSLRNAIDCSKSTEDVSGALTFFFPDLVIPTVAQLTEQKYLERTVALIRPNALRRKNSIIKIIEDNGFVISIQKEIQFTKEQAEEFYCQQKDEELYAAMITNMISGPSLALCLAKENAIQEWKDMLSPQIVDTTGNENEDERVNLQEEFALPEDTCKPLHATHSIEHLRREMEFLFPIENGVDIIQPETYKDDSDTVPSIEGNDEVASETNQSNTVDPAHVSGETNPEAIPLDTNVVSVSQPAPQTGVATDTTEVDLNPPSDDVEVSNEPPLSSEALNGDSTEVSQDLSVDNQADTNTNTSEVSPEQPLGESASNETSEGDSSVELSYQTKPDELSEVSASTKVSREGTLDETNLEQ